MDHETLISRIEIAAELGVQSLTIAHWRGLAGFPGRRSTSAVQVSRGIAFAGSCAPPESPRDLLADADNFEVVERHMDILIDQKADEGAEEGLERHLVDQ